jgi:hypothetical protein
MIYDCSKEMMDFLNEKVRLSEIDKEKLRGYRETNLTRLTNGLTKNGNPAHKRWISQGSYAMNTINQHPDNDYDLDIGIIFNKVDLVGKQGSDKTALEARKMVYMAMQDNRFKRQPEVLKNCVRVYYDEGHHIDMPVYRIYEKDGVTIQELASTDWKESDPESITSWYNDIVINKSPDINNGRQMRRVTRLGKNFMSSRPSWNMPSGFIFSILVDEWYKAVEGRDDESLYQTLKGIRDRLSWNKNIYNPVNGDLISEGKESQLTKLYDELDYQLDNTLYILDDYSCTKEEALKAWSKFFKNDFFKDAIVKSESAQDSSISGLTMLGLGALAGVAAAATVAAIAKKDDYEIKEPQKPWVRG